MGGGGRRFVDVADVQRFAVSRHAQLLQTGSTTDVADLRARARTDLAGGHPLHDRHQHLGQRRSPAAVHAFGDQLEDSNTSVIVT